MARPDQSVKKRQPKYRLVKHSLLERIARRQYTDSRPVPPERMLARELKVAPMTVWRAMKELVAEGVLVRHVGRGTFVRGTAAGRARPRSEACGILRRVGVVHTSELEGLRGDPVHFMTFLEIQSECAGCGIGLEFLPIPPGLSAEAAVRHVRDSGCQAVIALNSARYDLLVTLRSAGVPIVVTGPCCPLSTLDSVLPNDFQGGQLITDHLLGLGHGHVGIINGSLANSVSAQREAGWRSAIANASADEGLVYRVGISRASLEELRNHLVGQFRRHPPPSALFARDGLTAYAAILALREMGLQCPANVSVGCMGSAFERSMHMPHMTAAALADGALARGVLRLVEDLVAGRCDSPVGMVLPMHIVEGTTTCRVG